jgi:hypothetical protein
MPNHVTNRVIIRGPAGAVSAFAAAHIRPAGRGLPSFDFETVAPMPPILKEVEKGSNTDWGLIILGHDQAKAEAMLGYKWVQEAGVTSVEQLRAFLRRQHPGAAEKAEKAVAAERETGFRDWYDWSVVHWGTKWNAYDYEPVAERAGYFEFTFNTAWAAPEPIFRLLAAKWPTLSFTFASFDEGWNFAYMGKGDLGQFLGKSVAATPKAFEAVYGHAPEPAD